MRLLTFCLKHQYTRDDVRAVGTLKDEYLRAFRAVPQYVPWEKPKHHFLEHLAKYLELFGPFRDYWCMPWEAFLQILKRLFSMTNYKSAPQTVGMLWSLKAARGLKSGARIAWFGTSSWPISAPVLGESILPPANQSSMALRS